MDEELVIRKGIDLLMKGLGPLEAIRFINIPRDATIDSVKRHRKWQQQLKKNDFFDAVFSETIK
jgi:transposase-like protein